MAPVVNAEIYNLQAQTFTNGWSGNFPRNATRNVWQTEKKSYMIRAGTKRGPVPSAELYDLRADILRTRAT